MARLLRSPATHGFSSFSSWDSQSSRLLVSQVPRRGNRRSEDRNPTLPPPQASSHYCIFQKEPVVVVVEELA
jgi:hypothetical protein